MMRKTQFLGILSLSLAMGWVVLFSMPVQADIYRYVDSNGVVHFTNVPTVPGYSVYMQEIPKAYRVNSLYDRYISAASREHGISTSLIKAVIKAESNFNPRAVSRKGARGLMQLMPETARDLGIYDPFDPKENIFGGTRYLKEMLTQFRGSVPLALAAYNAGPQKVQGRNRIPGIPETRDFVRRVLKYLEHY